MIGLAFAAGAEWALPWDVNCFMNEAAWANLSSVVILHTRDDVNHTTLMNTSSVWLAETSSDNASTIIMSNSSSPSALLRPPPVSVVSNSSIISPKYFYVPMARVVGNALVLNGTYVPPSIAEEPQLLFHHTAVERFDASKPYDCDVGVGQRRQEHV